MGPVLNFLYITKELKGHPLYYNFGLYEMVVFNIVYTFVLESPFVLKVLPYDVLDEGIPDPHIDP